MRFSFTINQNQETIVPVGFNKPAGTTTAQAQVRTPDSDSWVNTSDIAVVVNTNNLMLTVSAANAIASKWPRDFRVLVTNAGLTWTAVSGTAGFQKPRTAPGAGDGTVTPAAFDPTVDAYVKSLTNVLTLDSASPDNAEIIQNAIDDAASAGGGTVIIPAGQYITGPLKLKTRVCLKGVGFNSQLILKNGSNAHLISLFNNQTEQTQIEDIWLDGNKANNTGNIDVVNYGNTGYNNGNAFPSLADPNHYMRRVSIVNGKRSGVRVEGEYSQSQIENVLVADCDVYSFHLFAPDCHLVSCVSRRSGLDGFYIAGNSNRLMNCKSFLSGRLDATNGSGFRVATVNRIDMTHCEAQDNRQHGFSLNTTSHSSFVACRGDRNGLGPEPVAGWGGDGAYLFAVTDSRLDFVFGDRNEGGTRRQRWGFNSGGSNDRNIVSIVIGPGADASKGNNGGLGANSIGYVRWNSTTPSGVFA